MRRRLPTLLLVAWTAGCATSKVKGPEGDAQARKADELMDDAEHAMRTFEVDSAQADLVKVRELLKDPRLQTHPDLSVLWDRFNQEQGDLEIARKDKAKHELDLKVNAQQQNLERARGPLLKAMEELDKPDLTQGQLDAVKSAQKKLQEALASGKSLEAQSPSYLEDAKHGARLVDKATPALAFAEKKLAFVTGPLAAAEAGLKLSADARAEKDKTKKEPICNDAKVKLQSCVDGQAKAVQDTPELAKTSVLLEGKSRTVDAVGAACKTALKTNDKLLALLAKAPKKKKR